MDPTLFEQYFVLFDESGVTRRPCDLFLDFSYRLTGLSAIFQDEAATKKKYLLSSEYHRLHIAGSEAFCVGIGVMDRLPVVPVNVENNPDYGRTLYQSGSFTDYGTKQDYSIPKLQEYLARNDVEVSRALWQTLCQVKPEVLQARYRPNARAEFRSAPSQLVHHLRKAAWIPDRDGIFHKQAGISRDRLREDFPWENANCWLTAIEFGKAAMHIEAEAKAREAQRESAATTLGIPVELADELGTLSPDELRQLVLKVKSHRHRQFPVRRPSNPERRITQVAGAANDAPDIEYGKPRRRVRTTNRETKIAARQYLIDLYTNDDDELVCQICEEVMPFKLRNGAYYFETVEFLDLEREHRENYLALCPTCSAKFNYADATTDEELLESTLRVENDTVSVSLAHEEGTIRFVETHLIDLRAVLGVTAEV
ncbi:MAG: hypothetical protein H0X65_06230 [Gemmatimonadetes bacterium]|nr:hypothetical protein [Gemmatimonadota bacterium]